MHEGYFLISSGVCSRHTHFREMEKIHNRGPQALAAYKFLRLEVIHNHIELQNADP